MWLAMRLGARAENFLSEAELRHIAAPVLMIWGDEDPLRRPGDRPGVPRGHAT